MANETCDTVIIGAGQAGLALSKHLNDRNCPHLILERHRIAERWRTERWDSLVANGPAWHDRFPALAFGDVDPDAFASKDQVVAYLETFAERFAAPVRTGIEVTSVTRRNGGGFRVDTADGTIDAKNVVAATGPFQKPIVPEVIPVDFGVTQIHSSAYRNPADLPDGGVLVIGAGSSGAQIADELLAAGRDVYLSLGPHDRPPRHYRGKDFVWWLGVLGKWDAEALEPHMEHVTIAVSGADGGHTVDFRRFAQRGMTLLGRAGAFIDGAMTFADDLGRNLAQGDANYLSVLDEADAYVTLQGLDMPEEPNARRIDPDPPCVTEPILSLDLKAAGIGTVIWATGYALDFGWLKIDAAFDADGRPKHDKGVTDVPGLYFLGLPWLSRRASAFIWGVWHDAEYLASCIRGEHRSSDT